MRSAAAFVALAAVGVAPAAPVPAGEYGGVYSPQISQDDAPWVLVELDGDYESPVLFGAVPSDSGDDETVVRFRNLRRGPDCVGWCFDLRIEEPSCRDGVHDSVRVGWMALEEGVFSFASQHLFADESYTLYEVGKVPITSDGSDGFVDVDFDPYFVTAVPGKKTVITDVQTSNIADLVKTRQGQRSGHAGFRVALDGSSGSPVGGEVVGWLAMPSGSGFFSGYTYLAETATDMVAHQSHIIDFGSAFRNEPYIFASIASFDTTDRAVLRMHDLTTQFVTVYIGADQCPSGDENQNQKETVHFLALPGILGHASISAEPANVRTQAVKVDGTVVVESVHPYQVYSNGRWIGNGGGAESPIQDSWDFRSHVRSTVTVLAITAQSSDVQNNGMVIEATINGAPPTGQWKCAGTAELGWEQEQFDDSDWPTAVTVPGTQQIWADGQQAAFGQVYCRLSTEVVPRATSVGELPMGEKGSMSISSEWRTVELSREYQNPVVFGGIPSYTNAGEAAVRVRGLRNGGDGCRGWCFDIRLQEPSCRNDRHADEYASWLVAEAGTYATDESNIMQIGEQRLIGDSFYPIQFAPMGPAANSVIFTQLQTNDAPNLVRVHVQVDASGFAVALQPGNPEPSGFHGHDAVAESVGWLIMGEDAGHIGGVPYFTQAVSIRTGALLDLDFGNSFNTVPLMFGSTTSPTGDSDTSVRITAPLSTMSTQAMLQGDDCDASSTVETATLGFMAFGASSGVIHAKAASVDPVRITATADVSSRATADDSSQFIVVDSVLRFAGVIAHPGLVARAHIRLVSGQDSQHPTALEMRAYSNDSCTWATARNIAKTTAQVAWTPASWNRGAEYWTPDISGIVAEVVQQPSWRSGDSICVTVQSATKTPLDVSMTAFAAGADDARMTPMLTIVSEPCASVNCGDNGFCVSGTCTCMNGHFGDHCENPPGPPSLCNPITERYLPLVSLHCTDNPCADRCVELAVPLYGSEPWLWRRFSTVCNLKGAVEDLGIPVDCPVPAPTNFSGGSSGMPAAASKCAWQGSGCVAKLDENVMAAVTPRRGDTGTGKGFQACFAATNQDGCDVMDWCWWISSESSCEPRTHSMLTVALAALSEFDPLYDASLDPYGHFLHLADECGRHSEHVCEVLRSCDWSATVGACTLSNAIVSELLKSPSTSTAWEHAATCRGRPSDECVGQCSWSGAVETCMLSPQMDHTRPDSAENDELCIDDAWGVLDSSGLTCQDLLSYGTCSFDLRNMFTSFPTGMTIASICQASCGECGETCVDLDACPELLQWWYQSEGGGCASGGTLSDSCPRTCGLCTSLSATDGTTSINVAEEQVAASYGSSVSAIHESAAFQMNYGIAAVAAHGQECAILPQHNCTVLPQCTWYEETASCALESAQAMSHFLGDARRTPLGTSLLRWSRATEECASLADEASCVATDIDDPTSMTGSDSSEGDNGSNTTTLKLAPLAAVAGLLTVWAFGSLVVGRQAKKQKVATDMADSLSFDVGGLSKSSVDGTYDGLSIVKTEPPSTIASHSWTDGAVFGMVEGDGIADLPGMSTEVVPWSDYMDTSGATAAPFNLPFLGTKSEPCADSLWEDTGSDTGASSGPESIVGDARSPYSDHYSTPETDVTSNSTPPNLASVQEDEESLDSFITGLTYNEAASLSSMPDLLVPQPASFGADHAQPNTLLQPAPTTVVGQTVAHAVSAAATAASAGAATAQLGRSTAVLLPPSASKQGVTATAKRGHRKRKLTEQKKEAVTGVVFLLCRSDVLSALEEIPEANLRSRYNIDPAAATGSAQCGVLLRYGADSKRAKLLLATALNDIFRALDWDLAQPVDKPVKWGTIQRDILWKYQKREGSDSVYLFNVEQATLERYAAAIEERLPTRISDILMATIRRVEAVGAEIAKQEREGGGAPKQLFHCPVEGCGYSTPERRYIMGHMRVHSGHKPFKCQVEGCGYASYSSQHLTRHARVHSGERPFKCSWPNCGYAASQKGHLQSHMLKHTGQRPFKCPFPGCDFACTRSWHLDRHKSKHGDRGAAVTDNDVYADVSEDEAEQEARQCRAISSDAFSGPVGLPGLQRLLPAHVQPQQQDTVRAMSSDWMRVISAPPVPQGPALRAASPVLLAPPSAPGSGGVSGATTPPILEGSANGNIPQ